MTDTSKSEAARFFIKGKNLRTDRPGLVEYYVGSLNHLSLALVDSEIAQHKGPGVRLTLTGVPTDKEIEDGDMSAFLKNLRLDSRGTVCALDMSLRRNVEGWFQADADKGPRLFEHIKKLHIRFPEEPEDNKVSLQDVNRILKESLTPDNRFPSLEELHISGLNEKEAQNAQDDPLIGPKLFVLLIDGPSMLQLVEMAGQSIGYRVATTTHRVDEQDASNGIDSASRSGRDWLTFTKSK